MRILITGGCGFIGRNLVEELAREAHDIHVVDRNHNPLGGLATVWRDNVGPGWRPPVLNIDAIIHLAAEPGIQVSLRSPTVSFDDEDATRAVLDAARRYDIPRVVVASSMAAKHGENPYAGSKRCAEAWCRAFAFGYGMTTVALRLANVYGPHSEHKTSVVANFVRAAVKGEPLVVHGDGAQRRDFIHVSDVARAFIAACRAPLEGYHCFEIGTGRRHDIMFLARAVSEAFGGCEIRHEGAHVGAGDAEPCNPVLAQRALGWRAEVMLEQGILTVLPRKAAA
jgi:UDP-glucose 4-epimerase